MKRDIHRPLAKKQALELAQGKDNGPKKQRVGNIKISNVGGDVIAEGTQDLDSVESEMQQEVNESGTPARLVCEDHKYDRWFIPGHKKSYGPKFGKMLAKHHVNQGVQS